MQLLRCLNSCNAAELLKKMIFQNKQNTIDKEILTLCA